MINVTHLKVNQSREVRPIYGEGPYYGDIVRYEPDKHTTMRLEMEMVYDARDEALASAIIKAVDQARREWLKQTLQDEGDDK